MAAFIAFADLYNVRNSGLITKGAVEAKAHSSSEFILAASGIGRRHVLDKVGAIDTTGSIHGCVRAAMAAVYMIAKAASAQHWSSIPRGRVVTGIEAGSNGRYISLCRRQWRDAKRK